LCYVDECHVCAGNEQIYTTHHVYWLRGQRSDDPDDPKYCHPTLFWYAFWLTTSSYIVAGVIIIVVVIAVLALWLCVAME